MKKVVVTDQAFGGTPAKAAVAAAHGALFRAHQYAAEDESVADYAGASMLSLIRKVTVNDRNIKQKGWCAPADVGPIRGFADTTVGLLETGRIGLAVARRLIPFGFSLIAHDPYASPDFLRSEGIELVDRTTL